MRPLIFDMLFHDDRMFVLEISPVTTRSSISESPEKKEWVVITRRNVPGYPPHRSDTFPTREEALSFYKKVVVSTPRVSLKEKSPDPEPTLEQYSEWLFKEELFDPVLNPKSKNKQT